MSLNSSQAASFAIPPQPRQRLEWLLVNSENRDPSISYGPELQLQEKLFSAQTGASLVWRDGI